jgi:hypothetical protein
MAEEDSLAAAKADVDAATGCRSRARSPSRMGFRIAGLGQNEGGGSIRSTSTDAWRRPRAAAKPRSMAVVGKGFGVGSAQIQNERLYPPWMVWAGIHIHFLALSGLRISVRVPYGSGEEDYVFHWVLAEANRVDSAECMEGKWRILFCSRARRGAFARNLVVWMNTCDESACRKHH